MSIAKLEHEATARGGTADGSRHLRVVHQRAKVDLRAVERAVHALLLARGC